MFNRNDFLDNSSSWPPLGIRIEIGARGVEMLQVKPLWFPRRRKTSYNKKKLCATRNGSIHVMSTTTGYAWDIFSFAGILVLRECLGDLPWPSFSSFFLRILVLRVCLGHLQFCGNAWETFRNNNGGALTCASHFVSLAPLSHLRLSCITCASVFVSLAPTCLVWVYTCPHL